MGEKYELSVSVRELDNEGREEEGVIYSVIDGSLSPSPSIPSIRNSFPTKRKSTSKNPSHKPSLSDKINGFLEEEDDEDNSLLSIEVSNEEE